MWYIGKQVREAALCPEPSVVSTLLDDVLLNVKEPNRDARLETGDPPGDPAFPFTSNMRLLLRKNNEFISSR